MFAFSNPPLQAPPNYYMNVGPPVPYHNQWVQQHQQPQRSRKAIPRPWLVKKQQPQQYPSNQEVEGPYYAVQHPKEPWITTSPSSQKQYHQSLDKQSIKVEVLADPPSWSMSLSKLTSCWHCLRPNNAAAVAPSPKETNFPSDRLLSQIQQQNQYNYPPPVPFPAFPQFRRHSSQSLFSYEVQEPPSDMQQQHNEIWTKSNDDDSNNKNGLSCGTNIFWGNHRGGNEDPSLSSVTPGDDASSTSTTITDASSTSSHNKAPRQKEKYRYCDAELALPPPIDRTPSTATGCSSIPPPPPTSSSSSSRSIVPQQMQQQQQQQQQQILAPSKQSSLLARRPSAKNLPPLGRSSSMSSSVGGSGGEAVVSPHRHSLLNSIPSASTAATPSTMMLLQHNKDAVIGLPPSRGRCDTGEYSKMSQTTTSSRHRRQRQFRFSQQSMELIIDGYSKQQQQSPAPPPIVTTKIRPSPFLDAPYSGSMPLATANSGDSSNGGAWNFPAITHNDSGYVSPLEDDDECDDDDHEYVSRRDYYSNGGEDEDWDYREMKAGFNSTQILGGIDTIGEDEDSLSPFAQLDRKVMKENDAAIHDGDNIRKQKRDFHQAGESPGADCIPTTPASIRLFPFVPTYLWKSPKLEETLLRRLENMQEGSSATRVVFSGWIAVSLGGDPDSFDQRHFRDPMQPLVSWHDLKYLCLTVNGTTGRASLVLCQPQHRPSGDSTVNEDENNDLTIQQYDLERDWMVQSREISSRVGRCIVVRRVFYQPKEQALVMSLFPVSLQPEFFADTEAGILISPTKFSKLRDHLFVPQPSHNSVGSGSGSGSTGFMNRAYAPDEQQDAVMHLMFSLGTSIKSSPLA